MLSSEVFRKSLVWLSLFSIAMGYLESAVVVYLREISYPAGFAFPLAPMQQSLGLTEFLREAATMVMLLSVGYLTGRNLMERFAWFIYCFAVWDIFYYVFLKLILDWPATLLTWDILFLIPVAWTGPVIAPVITSATMILLAMVLLYFSVPKNRVVRIRPMEWALLIGGSFVMILSFVWDYCGYVFRSGGTFGEVFGIANNPFLFRYMPFTFNWLLFAVAELILLAAIVRIWKRMSRTTG